MQIDFLVRWLPPRIDGVGDYTWNLANTLRESGIDIRIFTSTELAGKGLVQNEWIFPIISEWKPREVIKALKVVVRDNAADWICFQYVPQMFGRWGICSQVADILWALKRKFHCNIAVTFHEFIPKWTASLKDIFLTSALHLQTKRILSTTDLAITTCNRYKDTLKRLSSHPLPIVVIPVGSNIEHSFIAPEMLAKARSKIFPIGAKIFGLFSRLSASRNFPLALKTLKEARKQGLDAKLLLIGKIENSNPKLFQELMLLADTLGIKQHILTTGELSKEDLSVYLRMVDIFIFPQIDGISTRNTVLMAALAFGLPVVSFKPQAGNFDSFDIPCAKLVDIGNEEAFIEAAIEYLKHSDNMQMASKSNSDYYRKHFSWQIIGEQYLKALNVQ